MKYILGFFLRRILKKFNYKLVSANFINWALDDKEFYNVFNKQKLFGWVEDTGPKIQRMYMLKILLFMVKSVPGEWAEVGVYKGSTSFLMSEYGKKHNLINKESKIHIFDSFKGVSKPQPEDKDTFIKEGDYSAGDDEGKDSKYDCSTEG